MSNPLIEKYFELYPEKKEEPKPDYYEGEKSYAEELEEIEFPPEWSTTSVTPTTINPNSLMPITAANHIPPPLPPFKTLTSYDTHSVEDSFLQIAEKVKNKEAKVVYMSMNMEHYVKSVTFEVQVYT